MYRPVRCQPVTLAVVVAIAAGIASACGGVTLAARPLPVCHQSQAAPQYRQAIAAVRPLLRRLKAGLRSPGLSLAVPARGQIVWSISCGYADLKSRPVTAHTRFRIGSVSKTLTAAALAHYADSGRVDLDAPIDRYVDFPSHGGAITLRRLAGHLAGIRHYQTRAEAVNRRHFASVRDTLAVFADDPLVAEPGTRFSYSSYGYDVIGAALERVSGQNFATLMREAILAPAAMRDTTLATAPRSVRSTFYELEDGGAVRVAPPIDPQRPFAGRRLPVDGERPGPLRRRPDRRRPRRASDGGHDVHLGAHDRRRGDRLRPRLRGAREPIRVVRRPYRRRRRRHGGAPDPRQDRHRAGLDDQSGLRDGGLAAAAEAGHARPAPADAAVHPRPLGEYLRPGRPGPARTAQASARSGRVSDVASRGCSDPAKTWRTCSRWRR